MSLKLVACESLGAVSYSPSIVTVAVSVAVCEIFNVKEWRDLEKQVRSRSRSLKMAPFDRPYATFYWSAIVNTMAVSVVVCKSLKEWCDLENRVRVRSRSLEVAPFDRSHTRSYSPSIVTMAISCIVCEI